MAHSAERETRMSPVQENIVSFVDESPAILTETVRLYIDSGIIRIIAAGATVYVDLTEDLTNIVYEDGEEETRVLARFGDTYFRIPRNRFQLFV